MGILGLGRRQRRIFTSGYAAARSERDHWAGCRSRF